MLADKVRMPTATDALRGRDEAMPVTEPHYVNHRPLTPPYPQGARKAMFGMGCFWGAERLFWELPGVWLTAVGYAGGYTRNPTYREVCSGRTGHNEVVLVFYDPDRIDYADLLRTFWENHDPTQGMRQGNDVGTQYRSGIYFFDDAQQTAAEVSLQAYQDALNAGGRGAITTEIATAGPYYFAEDYHQGYLAKNPAGYCGIGGTGVVCPIGVTAVT